MFDQKPGAPTRPVFLRPSLEVRFSHENIGIGIPPCESVYLRIR